MTCAPQVKFLDHSDGTYSARFVATVAGRYNVRVRGVPSLVGAHGSPFAVEVQPAEEVDAVKSEALRVGAEQTAGAEFAFRLSARDRFGNEKLGAPDLWFVDARALQPSQNATGRVDDGCDGHYHGAVRLTMSGRYNVRVYYNGTASRASPHAVRVIAAPATSAASLLLAPGGVLRATADAFAAFTVQLADEFGNNRTEGGDRVAVAIAAGPGSAPGAVLLTDNLDGSHGVLLRFTRAGTYVLALGLRVLDDALPFSPVTVLVAPGAPEASMGLLAGVGATGATAGVNATFEIRMADRYGNPAPQPGIDVELQLYRLGRDGRRHDESEAAEAEEALGAYSGVYARTRAGRYELAVLVDGAPLFGSPFELYVAAAAVDPPSCRAFQIWPGAAAVTAAALEAEGRFAAGVYGGPPGAPWYVVLVLRDEFGNHVNRPGAQFAAALTPVGTAGPQRALGFGFELLEIVAPTAGPYSLSVALEGRNISGSPFAIRAGAPGAVHAPQSRAVGDGVQFATAGREAAVTIQVPPPPPPLPLPY